MILPNDFLPSMMKNFGKVQKFAKVAFEFDIRHKRIERKCC